MRTSSTHTKRLPWTVVDPPSEIFRNCTGLSEGDWFDLGETVLSVAELARFSLSQGQKRDIRDRANVLRFTQESRPRTNSTSLVEFGYRCAPVSPCASHIGLGLRALLHPSLAFRRPDDRTIHFMPQARRITVKTGNCRVRCELVLKRQTPALLGGSRWDCLYCRRHRTSYGSLTDANPAILLV
jgi:hypothetical protein